MKLKNFKIKDRYLFELYFEDEVKRVVDLKELIASKVSPDEIKTANIDKDWGCLEFKSGLVDIDPKTLYHFAQK